MFFPQQKVEGDNVSKDQGPAYSSLPYGKSTHNILTQSENKKIRLLNVKYQI